MKTLQFISFLLFINAVSPVSGQMPATLTGFVTDETGVPLPFASVGVVNTPVGTVADDNGRFTLYLTGAVRLTDTVQISLLGYKSDRRPIGQLAEVSQVDLVVTLMPRPAQLAEVTVRSSQWQIRQTGNTNTQTRMKTNFALAGKPRQNLGAQIGRVFRIPKRGAFLEEFRFFVSVNNFDSTRFRINVQTLRLNYPDSNLLQRAMYVELKPKQTGWITVDLRPYNLFAADNVAVSVEWVDYGGKGNYLGIPITVPSVGAVHLYKFASQSSWKKFGQMSACMNLTMLCAP